MKLCWAAVAMAMSVHGFKKPRLEVVKLVWDRHDRCHAVRSLYRDEILSVVKQVRLGQGRSWDDFSEDEQILFCSASQYLKAIKNAVIERKLSLVHPFDANPKDEGVNDMGLGWEFTPDDILATDDLMNFAKRYGIKTESLTKVIELLEKPPIELLEQTPIKILEEPPVKILEQTPIKLEKPPIEADKRSVLFNTWVDRLEKELVGTPWDLQNFPVKKAEFVNKHLVPPGLESNFDRTFRTQSRITLKVGKRPSTPSELLEILIRVRESFIQNPVQR